MGHWTREAAGPNMISEFGLSMHVESHRGSETRNMLIDFGFTPQAVITHAALLSVEPAKLDALVLSHGHYEGPSLVADHGFTSGQIRLASFEKLLSPTAMKIGVEHGVGCYAEKFSEAERVKATIPDQFRHEIATTFNLKGRGLVVLTSSSHRGVVNAIKQAQALSGVSKVHAVIGGFHLAPYQEDYVRNTVNSLKEIGADYIIPLHCTGEPFYEIARAEMPTKLLRSYTGTRFVFDA
jgi:7,8-dihydropterin-6-yl-methyl-4-(beta-D-ribofuranosyl)aminobenzene 5'-phosphate synthase